MNPPSSAARPLVVKAPIPSSRKGTTAIPEIAAAFLESGLATPSYVLDQCAFHHNGSILKHVQDETGAKILLAQKAFSCNAIYPILRNYLAGTTASGLFEARLAAEEFGGDVHVFSPAYKPDEMTALVEIADHIVFNSVAQWNRYREQVLCADRHISAGLRINPEYSEACAEIYDPCAPGSRFGVLASLLKMEDLDGIEGLHFHTLCEQGADALERTLEHVFAKFDKYLKKMKWLNMGGGHLITSDHYDVPRLIRIIRDIQARYPNLQVFLEPGEAISSGAGVLIGSVIDIVENGMQIAVLDVSATTHMPDVLEMPYRPDVEGSGQPGEKAHTYRFAGPTCLSGDVIGDYSFDRPLQLGDQLVFHDMAHYTMVKNSTFNGVPLPSIAIMRDGGPVELVREFSYDNFKCRLG
ncbi:carboxynorspermidine decarboxylase [bacterium]|nr:carboxynorspermidine decarboxylase [Akkermansiaceae bacterium]MDB4504402.1 carboxynorspermidine decarboxylase [Akkermansiaceae bacterium]MDB4588151.1 carboxynorspermidine decarboxylase [bacterium]